MAFVNKYGNSAVDATRKNALPPYLDILINSGALGGGTNANVIRLSIAPNDWIETTNTGQWEYYLTIEGTHSGSRIVCLPSNEASWAIGNGQCYPGRKNDQVRFTIWSSARPTETYTPILLIFEQDSMAPIYDEALSSISINAVQNKVVYNALALKADAATVANFASQIARKVDKIEGKGLSTNDFTNSDKTKLDGIESEAQKNVNADWNAISGDAEILNKPIIPIKTSQLENDTDFITKSVNNLTYYYLKSETMSAQEIHDAISAINSWSIEIGELPQEGKSFTMYLVPQSSSETNNVHLEYIWVNDAWELIGSTAIDLSNYYTVVEIDGKFVQVDSRIDNLTTLVNTNKSETDTRLGEIEINFSSLEQNVNDAVDNVNTTVTVLNSEMATIRGEMNEVNASLEGKANKESPIFTGIPTAPTPVSGDNSTQLATTEFVSKALEAHGSGHEIVDVTGTAFPQRGKLQFDGAEITDSEENNTTIITTKIPDGIGAVYYQREVILPAASWEADKTQTIAVDAANADCPIFVTTDRTSKYTYITNGISIVGQRVGFVTFGCEVIPTEDLNLRLLLFSIAGIPENLLNNALGKIVNTETITLVAANWNENQQVISTELVDKESIVFSQPTKESEEGYVVDGISFNQGFKTLTFKCTNIPTVDYNVKIIVFNAASGVSTPIDDKYVKMGELLDLIYPVGSIYLNVNNINPEILLGGTWERIQDTFLLGASSTYIAGMSGGETSHTLTVDEIPRTNILMDGYYGEVVQWMDGAIQPKRTSGLVGGLGHWPSGYGPPNGIVQTEGKGQPHNNMPPYLAVYIWKRMA